jgi:O-antigen ligase
VVFAALEAQGGTLPVTVTKLAIIGYGFYALSQNTIDKYTLAIICCVTLFIYSMLTSTLIASSAIMALSIFTACIFSLSVAPFRVSTEPDKTQAYYLFCKALLILSSIHSIVLIINYYNDPIRQTGLLRDYSQASMLILMSYGLCYLKLRKTVLFFPITTLFFLGFFTTFSRTSNALLVVFLIILFFIEFNKFSLKSFLKTICLIVLCAIIVKYFPLLIDQETVSRGGLEHFKTLNSRTSYWSIAWNAILEKPWTGHGLNSYQFTGVQEMLPHHLIYHVHNDYLQIWHDLGIFWLILFLIIATRVLIISRPFEIIKINRKIRLQFHTDEHIILWFFIVISLMYMSINFLLVSSIFLIIIGVITVRLFELSKETKKITPTSQIELKHEAQ